MVEDSNPVWSPLQAFLNQYWKDRRAESVRSLEEYLRLFPGHDEVIAHSFSHSEGLRGAMIGHYDQGALDASARTRDRILALDIGHRDMQSTLIGLVQDPKVTSALRHLDIEPRSLVEDLERAPEELTRSKPGIAPLHQRASDSVNTAKHGVNDRPGSTVTAMDLFRGMLLQRDDPLIRWLAFKGVDAETAERIVREHPELDEVTPRRAAPVPATAEITLPTTVRSLVRTLGAGVLSVMHAARRCAGRLRPLRTTTELDPDIIVGIGRALGCAITVRPADGDPTAADAPVDE